MLGMIGVRAISLDHQSQAFATLAPAHVFEPALPAVFVRARSDRVRQCLRPGRPLVHRLSHPRSLARTRLTERPAAGAPFGAVGARTGLAGAAFSAVPASSGSKRPITPISSST